MRFHRVKLLFRIHLLCLSIVSTQQALGEEPEAPGGSQGLAAVGVDFDAALSSLNIDPLSTDGNGGPGGAGNGLLDSAEMALVRAVLVGEIPAAAADRDAIDRAGVEAAWRQTLASAEGDMEALSGTYPMGAIVVAGYVMVGSPESFQAIAAMTATFGVPLKGDYSLAKELGGTFGPDGDADGDGFTNRQEYMVSIDRGVGAYVAAALDPRLTPDPAELGKAPSGPDPIEKKRVGVVLYPGFEVLDVYGPIEMWAYVPEFEIVMVAEEAGPVTSAQGVPTVAALSFDSAPPLDVLLVPGGVGTFAAVNRPEMLEFLRRRHEESELTASVCTGSVLLAAAGVLDGRKATSNKLHFQLALETSSAVHWIERARWVDDGDVVTSSGVSAGMDMALHVVARLFGNARAEQIATWTEYVWNRDPDQDPFAASAGKHSSSAH